MLRDYQQAAHDAAIAWIKRTVSPCVIEAATGAGKSHIIAAIAKTLYRISNGKSILCIAPSAELVMQNKEKYIATGNKASVFSASVGEISIRHPVVFGTPMTVKNRIHKFKEKFCCVIIDECHLITPSIKDIIEKIKIHNKNVRVIGLTATPYRLGSGYIYATTEDGNPVDQAIDPYFVRRIYAIKAHELIARGYLTSPYIGTTDHHYDTSKLELNSLGRFKQETVEKAFIGYGRKTAAIVGDIVDKSKNRNGVMIFSATIDHAHEVMASLPKELSGLITGDTKKPERIKILSDFKKKKIKYLVNVSVLTTGFDAPHVDVIAILRATESAALLQQIIGRGLRLHEGKKDCLILDYAENIERHCPDGDVFNPKIKAFTKGETVLISAKCPECNAINEFSARKNEDGFSIDENGYFTDLNKNRIETDYGAIPAHFGRRCNAYVLHRGTYIRCGYRWTCKECEACGEENDIAARRCASCKAEIVDPNEKLKIEFKKLKSDPYKLQIDKVISMKIIDTVNRRGEEVKRIEWITPYRKFTTWLNKKFKSDYEKFIEATKNGKPKTITYAKNINNGFFRIYRYNDEAQKLLQEC